MVEREKRLACYPVSDPIIKREYPTAELNELAAKLAKLTAVEWSIKDVHNRAITLKLRRSVDQRLFPPALGTPRPPKVISFERAVLCSDFHIPFHDRDLLADMCKVARRDKCDTLIVAGDLVDCQAFARFDREEVPVDWEQETDCASGVLYELAATFPHVHLLPGNHGFRILRMLQGQATWSNIVKSWDIWDILDDEQRPKVSDIPIAYLDDWGLVCHPDQYSRIPGSVARQLAAIHQRDVFTGHEHALTQVWDVSGKHLCVGLGCMTRADLTGYKTMHVTTHPVWNPGWVTVIDRQVVLYPKGRYMV